MDHGKTALVKALTGVDTDRLPEEKARGIGRSLAMEILECLDRLGITQRIGDTRKMRKDFVPILGPATAPPAPSAVTPRVTAQFKPRA